MMLFTKEQRFALPKKLSLTRTACKLPLSGGTWLRLCLYLQSRFAWCSAETPFSLLVHFFFTSLPLKKARSSVGADLCLLALTPLLVSPPQGNVPPLQ